jgi:transposase
MNELSLQEQETILSLLRLGWSQRRVARETGHRRETIGRYARAAGLVSPAAIAGSKPAAEAEVPTDSRQGVEAEVPAGSKPATGAEVPTDSRPGVEAEVPAGSKPATEAEVPTDARQGVEAEVPAAGSKLAIEGGVPTEHDAATTKSRSSCEVHRPFIGAEVAKGRNGMAIFQDLVEHHGYEGSYDAVKRFVRQLVSSTPKFSCRFETLPGQEAQVDYGEGAPTLDARSGKYRKPRLFVLGLSFSRHAFRKVVWRSSQQVWCELHEEAFAHFGGTPEWIRLDNLKEGVIEPDIYDPELNKLYAALLKHYNIIALPCRPYAPDLKGKVESQISYAQGTALKGKRFELIDEQNAHLMHWDERWASTRIHGTTKRQVREMFEEERPALKPLPAARFEYYRIVERRVHFDGYIEIDGAYYSSPSRYIGTTVIVHAGRFFIRLIDPTNHQLFREHPVTGKGMRRTVDADLPKQTPPQVEKLVARIATLGQSCATFARAVETERGASALRTLFGVLDLARKYGPEALERACTMANAAKSSRYRFLRTYLQHHAQPKPLTERNPIIGNINTYVDHLRTLTKRQQGELFDDRR